jgi:hypothetical protein
VLFRQKRTGHHVDKPVCQRIIISVLLEKVIAFSAV